MNVFYFATYLEFVSPSDGKTVCRYPLKDIEDFKQHNILYQFTYDDLAPEQKDILNKSDDPIAQRLLLGLSARTVAEIRELSRITLYQFKMALHNEGVTMSSIDTIISNIVNVNNREKAEIYWSCASIVKRGHTFVNFIQTQLGWTDKQMDALFVAANLL